MKKTLTSLICCILLSASFGQNAEEFYKKGLEKAESGEFGEAIIFFSKTIELVPEDYYARYNRGIANTMLNNYEEALQDFEQIVSLAPDYKMGWLNRGTTKKHLTDYEGALSDYSYTIKLDPNYAIAYYNRGLVYELLSKKDAACMDFNKAKDLGMKSAAKKVENCNDTTKSTIVIHPILRLTKFAENVDYGFSSKNPIMVGTGPNGGPANQETYLELLRDIKGKPIKYIRIRSCCDYESENGFFGMAKLDQYEITYLNEKGEELKTSVYISFYDYEEPLIIFGFKTIGQR